jgi:hypothetical protein
MTLDFQELRGFPLKTWRADTDKRRYVIVKGETDSYTAKVGTLSSGDQEDIFRGAPSFEAAARACQAHVGGK